MVAVEPWLIGKGKKANGFKEPNLLHLPLISRVQNWVLVEK